MESDSFDDRHGDDGSDEVNGHAERGQPPCVGNEMTAVLHRSFNPWPTDPMTISQAHSVRRARIGVCHRSGPLSLDRNWKAGAIHPSFPLTIPSIDHVDPFAHGGRDDLTNLVTACWPCNTRKADLPLAWPVRAVEDSDPTWRRLTDQYGAQWVRAGSPPNYRPSVTRWAI